MKLITKFLAILFFSLGDCYAMEKPMIPVGKKMGSPVGRVKSREFPMKKPEEQNTFLAEEEKKWVDKRSKFKNSTEELATLLQKTKNSTIKGDTGEDSSTSSSPEQLSPNHKLHSANEDY